MAKKKAVQKETKGNTARAKAAPAKAATATAKSAAATLEGILGQLRSMGDEARRAHNTKYGAGDNQFGVKHGDIRALAKKIQTSHELAMPLWKTGNVDAQLLAILLIQPKALSAEEVDRLVRSVAFAHVAD